MRVRNQGPWHESISNWRKTAIVRTSWSLGSEFHFISLNAQARQQFFACAPYGEPGIVLGFKLGQAGYQCTVAEQVASSCKRQSFQYDCTHHNNTRTFFSVLSQCEAEATRQKWYICGLNTVYEAKLLEYIEIYGAKLWKFENSPQRQSDVQALSTWFLIPLLRLPPFRLYLMRTIDDCQQIKEASH